MSRGPRSVGGANTPERWQAQVRFDMAFANRVLLDKGSVAPIFVLHSDAGALVLIGPLTDKDTFYRIVSLHCAIHDAVALSAISEAWMRDVHSFPGESPADHNRRAMELLPSKAEDRKEVVLCILIWRDEGTGERRTVQDMREIERRANGKPSGLRQIPMERRSMAGDVANILPERIASDGEKRAAQALLDELERSGLQLHRIEVPTRRQ